MPKVSKPTVTEVEPFEFRTAARMRSRSVSHTTEPQMAAARFAARPLNRDMFVRVNGVPDKVFMELTVPESPAISKKRARVEALHSPPHEYPSFRAQPMPDFSDREQYPQRTGAIVTRQEPFNMGGEEISRRKRQKFQEEIARQREEEIARREFKAQSLYETSPERVYVERRSPTRPEPFNLQGVPRGEHYKRAFAQKIMAEEEAAKEQFSSFRARTADVM